ncbi:MAG: hypothetical protein V3W04_03260 [Gammaproteobacteria bacterium]
MMTASDSLLRFFNATAFNFGSDTQRKEMEQFILAFDSTLKPIVASNLR